VNLLHVYFVVWDMTPSKRRDARRQDLVAWRNQNRGAYSYRSGYHQVYPRQEIYHAGRG